MFCSHYVEEMSVSDSPALADIAARLKRLQEDAEAVDVPSSEATRFVVATDWNHAAAPLAVLRAYLAAYPAGAPVELCFAVPHEPSDQDARCVRVLVEGVGGEAALGPLAVESFNDVVKSAYDSAAVPVGDVDLLLTEVASLITRMFDISRRLGAGTGVVAGANQGDPDALRRRLEGFVG